MILENNITHKITDADYEQAEINLLRDGLNRSYKDRFLFLMMLVKIQATMQKMQLHRSIHHVNKV